MNYSISIFNIFAITICNIGIYLRYYYNTTNTIYFQREKEDYKNKMNHLQEAVRTHFSSLTSLKQQAAQYRQEKESAETRAEELRLKFQELTANSSLMQVSRTDGHTWIFWIE